jgi:hypothetical protein
MRFLWRLVSPGMWRHAVWGESYWTTDCRMRKAVRSRTTEFRSSHSSSNGGIFCAPAVARHREHSTFRYYNIFTVGRNISVADPSGESLRPIAFWGCRFESSRGAWMFVLHIQDKSTDKKNQDQKVVQMKYKEQKKIDIWTRYGLGWTVLGSNPGGGETSRTLPD